MKNQTIKEVAFLCVLFLGLAAVANADEINLISTGGTTGSFDFTAFINRTINVSNSGFDKLVLDISAVTGIQAGYGINAIGGTWICPMATGTGGYIMPDDAEVAAYNSANSSNYDWGAWIVTPGPPCPTASGLTSTVNLPDYVDGNSSDIARTPLGPAKPEEFTSFTGTWYGTTALSGTNFKVATLYLPTGWQPANGEVIFTGTFGFSSSSTENSVLEIATPEPATLVLLGTALIGLAAYAWRKRK